MDIRGDTSIKSSFGDQRGRNNPRLIIPITNEINDRPNVGVIRDDRDRQLSAVGKSVIGFRFGLTLRPSNLSYGMSIRRPIITDGIHARFPRSRSNSRGRNSWLIKRSEFASVRTVARVTRVVTRAITDPTYCAGTIAGPETVANSRDYFERRLPLSEMRC